jgi:hypothetical protein
MPQVMLATAFREEVSVSGLAITTQALFLESASGFARSGLVARNFGQQV